jgi:hypothetical protein
MRGVSDQELVDDFVQNRREPEQIVPIQVPPDEVTYVSASARPELIFDERAERATLENVQAFQAARDAIVEDGNSVIIGARR